MEELYPVADHFITHFGFDDAPNMWNTEVFFGGRYTLTMQVDVEIDYDAKRVTKVFGEPKFYLHEAQNVEILPDGRAQVSYAGQHERTFGPNGWTKLYNSKGDLAVIDLRTENEPVKSFD